MPRQSFIFTFVFSLLLTCTLHASPEQLSLDQLLVIKNPANVATLFPKTPEEMEEKYHLVQLNVEDCLEKILAIPHEERNFENTVLAYDRAVAFFGTYGSLLSTLQMVHPDQRMRDKSRELLVTWNEMMIDQFETNQALYYAFKMFQLTRGSMNEERQYYFTNLMTDFRRAGLELGSENYETLKQLQKQITLLCSQFANNIAQDSSKVRFKKADLLGLDNDFIQSQNQEGGEYILSCDYPTRSQVMSNCVVENTRRTFFRAFYNRAYPQNLSILSDLVDCRDELAQMLGYGSYAEYDIHTEMAKTPENVEKFLNGLTHRSQGKVAKTWELLTLDLPESVKLTPDGKIKPWDVAYLLQNYMRKHLNVDHNKISEYFPLESTIDGLMHIYEQFFGLKFQILPNQTFWEPSVQMMEVRQNDGTLIGYVLLDLFPREKKYTHACCNGIIYPMSSDGGQTIEPSLAIVITNFSKPSKTKDSLLRHAEVKTFFHEFGHAIHALLGQAEMPTKSGYNTKIDFVEMPSQLLEEWIWDRDILKMISCHYQTGKPLTDEMIETLHTSRSFGDCSHFAANNNGDNTATQVFLSELSLNLFKEGKNKNLQQLEKDIYLGAPRIVAYDPEIHFLCTFGHVRNYGAKYYSYLWSKQLALRVFDYIKTHGGLLDPALGKRYVSKIIGRGGSCDPNLLTSDFLKED